MSVTIQAPKADSDSFQSFHGSGSRSIISKAAERPQTQGRGAVNKLVPGYKIFIHPCFRAPAKTVLSSVPIWMNVRKAKCSACPARFPITPVANHHHQDHAVFSASMTSSGRGAISPSIQGSVRHDQSVSRSCSSRELSMKSTSL
jgi:hypothetical protein